MLKCALQVLSIIKKSFRVKQEVVILNFLIVISLADVQKRDIEAVISIQMFHFDRKKNLNLFHRTRASQIPSAPLT